MPHIIIKLFCRAFGQKFSKTYRVKREDYQSQLAEWDCPRCGETDKAMMLKSAMDGGEELFIAPTRFTNPQEQQRWAQEAMRRGASAIMGAAEAEALEQFQPFSKSKPPEQKFEN